jgi:hypothetical protein
VGDWQPIETAPMIDGQTLLMYDLDLGVCLGYWSDEFDGIPAGWNVQDTCGEYVGDVTHWMPLPPPPESSK